MSVLLDTNILARLLQQSHPHYPIALAAIAALKRQGDLLHIVPQNLYELWVLATRPAGATNGLGLNTQLIQKKMNEIKSVFQFVPDMPTIFSHWESLVSKHDAKGKTAHDARLVAAMIAHGITHILTFNDADFVRFNEITVLRPSHVAAIP